jgi:hypothetical protein
MKEKAEEFVASGWGSLSKGLMDVVSTSIEEV